MAGIVRMVGIVNIVKMLGRVIGWRGVACIDGNILKARIYTSKSALVSWKGDYFSTLFCTH